MAWPDLSLTDSYSAILTKINTGFTNVGKLFRDQATGDFTNQVRYNSTQKRFESWTGSTWQALDLSGTKPFRGAYVYGHNGGSIGTALAWLSEQYDTDNIHSSVSNTSRLTVPTGVSKVKLKARGVSDPGQPLGFSVIKNNTGSAVVQVYIPAGGAGVSVMASGASAVLQVVAGDYFEISLTAAAGSDSSGNGWFLTMEVVE